MNNSSLAPFPPRLSEERAAALVEQRIAYQDFMRAAIRSPEIRRLAANNRAYRHVARFLLHIAMYGGFATAEWAAFRTHPLFGIAAYPVFLFFQALVVSGLMIHSHELSHGHIRSKWLNDVLGIVSGLPSFINFYSFRHAHKFHHKNIGNLDAPEAGAPVSPTGQTKVRGGDLQRILSAAVGSRSAYLWMVVAWPIFVVLGDYSSWLLPYRVGKRVDVKSVAVFAGFVLASAIALSVAPFWTAALFLLPGCLGGNRILVITALHHAHEDSVFFSSKYHSYFNAMMCTTDRDYGAFINFFMMNNGYHIPHHVNPSIAYYDLKRASHYLRARIPAGLRYNFIPNSSLYRDFARELYDARPTKDHDVYQIVPDARLDAPTSAPSGEGSLAHA